MKEIWKGEPQFTYDYGEYGHYYTPVVRHHEDTYYGSKQHLGDKRVPTTTDVTIWDHIISVFSDKYVKYERYIREEHTWVFDSKAEAIAWMARNGLHIEEAVRVTEKVEALNNFDKAIDDLPER